MKLPKEVKGIHKIRDAVIIQLYNDGFSKQEIIELRNLKISIRRLDQILSNNRELLKIDKDWENIKQVHRIKRHIRTAPRSTKDPLEWEQLLDSKIGAKSDQSSSVQTKVIIIKESNGSRVEGQSEDRDVPRPLSVIRV